MSILDLFRRAAAPEPAAPAPDAAFDDLDRQTLHHFGRLAQAFASAYGAPPGFQDLADTAEQLLGPARAVRSPLEGLQIGDEDPHPSQILAKHEGEYLGALYEQMACHPEIEAAMVKRTGSVLTLPRYLVKAGKDRRDEVAFDFVRDTLAGMSMFSFLLAHQLQRPIHGVVADELIYERMPRGPVKGAIVPVDAFDVPMRRFGFRRGRLHLRTGNGLDLNPQPEHPLKFLVHRYGTKSSPWGRSICDSLFQDWRYLVAADKDHALLVARFALPLLFLTYQPDGDPKVRTEQESRLRRMLRAMRSEVNFGIPREFKPDMLESKRSPINVGGFAASRRARIYTLITGETGETTGHSDTGSGAAHSQARSRVVAETSHLITRSDAHELACRINDDLIRPLVAMNLGVEYLAHVPKFVINADEKEMISLRQSGLTIVLNENEKRLARGQKTIAISQRDFSAATLLRTPQPGEETIDDESATDDDGTEYEFTEDDHDHHE